MNIPRALVGLLFSLMIGFAPSLCVKVSADIRLPKIFSDKMVLQHGTVVRIWGTADPGQELEVSLGESSEPVVADGQGAWSVKLVPPEIGGPYELTVAGAESKVVFNDVYVGEVWICSGQSNMQWSLNQSLSFENDEEKEAYFAEINNPNIRLFTVPPNAIEEPAAEFSDAVVWEECRGEAVAEFSATAYFFATALQKYKKFEDMPIGLIDSSWGGTPVESWTSMEALSANEELNPLLEHWKENVENRSPNRPAVLFNGMIAPLIPYSVRGVIWYQGEANVGRAQQYQTIFPAMINDWRTRFDNGDIPFYYVQLAPHRYDKDPRALAELWDAQRKALKVPNTGMIGSSDIGNPEDIHPMNKDVVGDRLARMAMANTYGATDVVGSGPIYDRMEPAEEAGKIVIHFENAEGLKTSGGDMVEGFLICGEDGEFKPANAKVVDETVVVWAAEIERPTQVRFLWDDTAVGKLFNAADLPAIPFRTDSFELLSVGQDF